MDTSPTSEYVKHRYIIIFTAYFSISLMYSGSMQSLYLHPARVAASHIAHCLITAHHNTLLDIVPLFTFLSKIHSSFALASCHHQFRDGLAADTGDYHEYVAA